MIRTEIIKEIIRALEKVSWNELYFILYFLRAGKKGESGR